MRRAPVSPKSAKAKRAVRRQLQWLAAVPEDGKRGVLELHPTAAPPARTLRLVAALRDHEALQLFHQNVVSLWGAAVILGVSKEAVLALVERGELRALYVGGEDQWLFSTRRVTELAAAKPSFPLSECTTH